MPVEHFALEEHFLHCNIIPPKPKWGTNWSKLDCDLWKFREQIGGAATAYTIEKKLGILHEIDIKPPNII